LIERFFGLQPTGYMVVSGTLRLPIKHASGCGIEARRAHQTLRELTYHPERFIELTGPEAPCERCGGQKSGAMPDAQRLIDLKRRWIATPKSAENARERHEAIRSANEALQPCVAQRRSEIVAALDCLERESRAAAILDSREYSFCLYPEAQLRTFLDSQ